MNDHSPSELGLVFGTLARFSNTRFDAPATEDACQRILQFFETHLRDAAQ